MNKKDNDILDKFFNFLKQEVSTPIKKDFTWLGKIINEDLEKLTKEKKTIKKKEKKIKQITFSQSYYKIGYLNYYEIYKFCGSNY